jgi:hypothetical protein
MYLITNAVLLQSSIIHGLFLLANSSLSFSILYYVILYIFTNKKYKNGRFTPLKI